MKKFFGIAALFAALGLAAFFSACSNTVSGVDTPPPAAPVLPTYTVAFNSNGGSDVASQTVTSGQTASKPADPTKEHFKFVAWCSDQTCQAAFDFATPIKKDTILYAKWESVIYTVTFVYNNGSEAQTQSVASGQTAVKPDDPAKEHFNFAGWCSDEACQTPFDFATPITAPTTLYAKWSNLPVFAVTFDLNGGKYGSSDTYMQNVETGSKVSRPASDPIKDDNVGEGVTTKYAFVNWYADASFGTLFDFDATTITSPVTVYAKYNETNYYAVTIASGIEHGGVSSDATERVAAETIVTLAASPSAGYKLDAYTVTDADSNPVDVVDGKFTMPASPVTVSATFVAIEYTITCGTPKNGTVTADLQKATIGMTVTLTVAANEMYEFKNVVVKDSNGTSVFVTEITAGAAYSFSMPAGNVMVTASFKYDNPLTLEAREAGAEVYFRNEASGPVFYRVNGGAAQTIASGSSQFITLSKVGDKVCFYGDNAAYATSDSVFSKIDCTKDCYVYGNIMSLVDSENYENATALTQAYTFARLFYHSYEGEIWNKSGKDLVLPATTLTKSCYEEMFRDCNLRRAPELPATTLAESCYEEMFRDCRSLTSAPSLPATTLAESCYKSMFRGCVYYLTSAPKLPATTLAEGCYKSMFYGCKNLTSAPKLPATTLAKGCYNGMFRECASLRRAPELPATTLAEQCYYGMFGECTSLTSAPELPATTLAKRCYCRMFGGCTGLTSAPKLPATTLAEACYGGPWKLDGMFYGCINLTSAPELPATTLATQCYGGMFEGCTSLTSAPELPATTLATQCYSGMFYGCINLTSAPKLPATTLAEGCYNSMFWNCTSLTSAPELPATTLAEWCYCRMFWKCTSLTSAPELPATTLAEQCYCGMFGECTSLTSAPELPATTLANCCYGSKWADDSISFIAGGGGMFEGCANLTAAPELPATTLAEGCYQEMFKGCANLTAAPELPATTLAEECYASMFKGCANLTSVSCFANDISAQDCTKDWLDGVSSTGTFWKNTKLWPSGSSGIPTGWTYELIATKTPLTLEAIEAGAVVTFSNKAAGPVTYRVNDGVNQTIASSDTKKITLANVGDKVCFYGDNAVYSTSDGNSNIGCDKDCYVYGNIMSLVDSDGYINAKTLTENYTFYSLFYSNKHIINNPTFDLVLPATTLTEGCYDQMFSCCASLTAAPELPAKTLVEYCYAYMFFHCTGLTMAPELPATTLASYCYDSMFSGCASLASVTCLATDISAYKCTLDWLEGVKATGTFTKAAGMKNWSRGSSGRPEGWTVVNY